MPHHCSVFGCKGNYDTGPKVSVFKFPDDLETQSKWINRLQRKNFKVTKYSREEKVIRLQKNSSDAEYKTQDEQKEILQNQIEMSKKVLKSLLGEQLINCPILVFIEKRDVQMLNESFKNLRPKSRLHKNVKNEAMYALMLPDYCTLPVDLQKFPSKGPVISLEIKPKQGFLSKEVYLPSTQPASSMLKCRYCMMQNYKMKRNAIPSKSGYCPTDLFSGCPARMQHALKMLLETPRNNLRIFKNQELIFSEEIKNELDEVLFDFLDDSTVSASDVLCKLVLKVLLKCFLHKTPKPVKLIAQTELQNCDSAYPSCSKNGMCHQLPVGCVLYHILCLQMLEHLNIENLHDLYKTIKKENDDKFANNIGCFLRTEIPPYVGEKTRMETETDYQYASRKVWEFLLAVTLQDCSIMLVFKKYTGSLENNLSRNVVLDEAGHSYLFSIAIADLDPKSLSVVEKRFKETPHLLQSSLNMAV